jgi:hypothetical protein
VYEDIFAGLQAIGVIASILFAARQLVRNRRILANDSYERLSREYQSLLWQTMQYRHLDRVWEPLSEPDRKRLEKGQDDGNLWGVWFAMTPEEKDCYRYTRSALEIFERAWQLHNADHIDGETWKKWSGWIDTWANSSYIRFVLPEARPQLIENFAKTIDKRIASVASET